MISIDTVFVLGAGASVPYGYPTGRKLRNDIISKFVPRINSFKSRNDKLTHDFWDDLIEKANYFTKTFDDSSIESIDFFLARNPDFLEDGLGKIAIVTSIIEAETMSRFNSYEKRMEDWYSTLFNEMIDLGIPNPSGFEIFGENKVTFITFNYDRSLEQYLYLSLRNSFRSANEASIINSLLRIPIYHVYGVLGELPWQNRNGYEYGLSLKDLYWGNIQKLAENVDMVFEKNQLDFDIMGQALENAKRIFFLGFGYSRPNLEVLRISQYLNPFQNIYGTAIGLSDTYISETEGYLCKDKVREIQNFRNRIGLHIEKIDCFKLVEKYL